MDNARRLLATEPEGIVRSMGLAFRPGHGLGCCSLVRIFVMAIMGQVPPDALKGMVSWSDWRLLDKDMWDLANLNRPTWGPWDALLAASVASPGGQLALQLSTKDPRPTLYPGVNLVQYWNPAILTMEREDLPPHGHTVIEILEDDGTIRRVQSGRTKGYRDDPDVAWPRFDDAIVGVYRMGR